MIDLAIVNISIQPKDGLPIPNILMGVSSLHSRGLAVSGLCKLLTPSIASSLTGGVSSKIRQ